MVADVTSAALHASSLFLWPFWKKISNIFASVWLLRLFSSLLLFCFRWFAIVQFHIFSHKTTHHNSLLGWQYNLSTICWYRWIEIWPLIHSGIATLPLEEISALPEIVANFCSGLLISYYFSSSINKMFHWARYFSW